MNLKDLIYKHFREEYTIWFDYIDHIKANNDLQRKGLKYIKRFGRFEFYITSEEGDEILIDTLLNSDVAKFENILKIFW